MKDEKFRLGDVVTVNTRHEHYSIILLETPEEGSKRLYGQVISVKKSTSPEIVFVGNQYNGFLKDFFKHEKYAQDSLQLFNESLDKLELCFKSTTS